MLTRNAWLFLAFSILTSCSLEVELFTSVLLCAANHGKRNEVMAQKLSLMNSLQSPLGFTCLVNNSMDCSTVSGLDTRLARIDEY